MNVPHILVLPHLPIKFPKIINWGLKTFERTVGEA